MQALGDIGHSRILTPVQLRVQHQVTREAYEGIGVEVAMRNGQLVIVAPIDDSPAQRAGLKPGEIILAVNGENLRDRTLDEAIQNILGPAGTTVSLTILNPETDETRVVTLVRREIELEHGTWQRIPETPIALVRIASFSGGVTDELQEALRDIRQAGLTGVILDLRNNPGGLLTEAIGTANQFLESGNTLLVKDAEGVITSIPLQGDASAPDIPLVVLVNSGTASAVVQLRSRVRESPHRSRRARTGLCYNTGARTSPALFVLVVFQTPSLSFAGDITSTITNKQDCTAAAGLSSQHRRPGNGTYQSLRASRHLRRSGAGTACPHCPYLLEAALY